MGTSYFGKKIEFSEIFWNSVLFPINTNSGPNFNNIGPYLRELGPKIGQKWAISWMLHRQKNISQIFKLRNQKYYKDETYQDGASPSDLC